MQFWLLTAGSLWLLGVTDRFPHSFSVVAFLWFCASFYIQGAWLEGMPRARALEWLRLAVTLGLALIGHTLWPQVPQTLVVIVCTYCGLSALTLLIEQFSSSPVLTST